MNPKDFWQPFEYQINSFDDLVKVFDKVMSKSDSKDLSFAWRGLVNADWALHSSLYRRLALTTGNRPTEADLSAKEDEILADLHRWGLHAPITNGRLSILSQLAMLQHFGAPTRLIDVTFNAWVGAFFAVEEKWSNGALIHEDQDGRLFAIDITTRLINESTQKDWENHYEKRPWSQQDSFEPPDLRVWTSQVYAWKPPTLNTRISAQNGGFLLGGVPDTATPPNRSPFQVPKTPGSKNPCWTIDDVRASCCLALRPHLFDPRRGGVSSGALYSFRIAADAKKDIRKRLERLFGYTHSVIYPDYSGFADFGTPCLRQH